MMRTNQKTLLQDPASPSPLSGDFDRCRSSKVRAWVTGGDVEGGEVVPSLVSPESRPARALQSISSQDKQRRFCCRSRMATLT